MANAKLEEFERSVYGRKREDRVAENDAATKAMLQCLVSLRDGAGFEGHERFDNGVLNRFCSAVVALLTDPQYRLTQDGFDALCAERAVLETAFTASSYGGSDWVFTLIHPDEDGVSKYLALFGANSKLKLDLEQVFTNDPQATFGLYLSLISYAQIFSQEGDDRRTKLIGLCHLFENVKMPPALFNTLTGAYMHVSYASCANKHAPKRVFHKMLANMLANVERPVFGPQGRKEKPTILILFEWWWTKHAMYRSYARSIRQLKKRFHLIGCCPGNNTDSEAKEMFDEWLHIENDPMCLTTMANSIKEKQPDIIYYPSIGMAIWVIAMASLRLAPIQVMTYGHPATSNSPEIDYGIIEGDCYTKECFSETVIPLPPNVVRPTEYCSVAVKHAPRQTDTIKVAVAAMQVKVSWPFVQALKAFQKRCPKRVEFYFFSAAHGVGLYSMANELAKLLDNVTVQEKQLYEYYMESLADCDIATFSFPFGGANSVYDCMTLGMPMVSMEGRQPHEMSDASIFRRAGLPEWLIAHNQEEYVQALLRLADDEERGRIANQVGAIDVPGRFYQPDESDAFVDAFRNIYCMNTLEKAA